MGLVYDAAGHVILDPDTAVRGAVAHLFATFEATGSATACVKASAPPVSPSPGGTGQDPRKGEIDWKPLAHHVVPRVPHNPRYAGAFTFGRHRDVKLPGGKLSRTSAPQEWISFIPGAHPGYITLDQYDANRAQLTANAAAHGRDRTAGPPREGPALLQGIIVCGTCGLRMTVRYHQRRGRDLPTYVCQRDGIEHARRICQAVPGADPGQRIGRLLIDTLTPLTIEAALTVQAELQHRADDADALRAAHVERARYHADLARRRYLARPANRLVADTLEADWNTALRALSQAQDTYDQSRKNNTGQLTDARTGSTNWPPTCPPSGTTPPPRPGTQAHRPAATHRRHRHPNPLHHHRAHPPARRPAPHPHHAGPAHRSPAAQDTRRGRRRRRRATRSPHRRRDRRRRRGVAVRGCGAVVVADVADDEPVEGAAFAAGQAAVVEDAGDLGVGVVIE